jgi:SagB-type dehydrogenase family enzyme
MITYGDDFQNLSKYKRESLGGKNLDWTNKPPVYKKYPPELKRFELSKPQLSGGLPFFSVLKDRRSERNFSDAAISEKIFSQILWAVQGISLTNEYHQFRTAPSAGGLFPIETYCVVNRVEGFEPGIYHYQVPYHNLVLIRSGSFGTELARAALGQKMVRDAAFNLVWSAMIARSKWKYEQRAYRYIYLDAGHIGQNAALAAVASGLGSCQIGAFFDEEVNAIIEIDGQTETAVYLTAIGTAG